MTDHPDLEHGKVYADRSDPMSRVLPIREAAHQAGVTPRTVNRWIKTGKLRVIITPASGRYVVESELLECEKRCHLAARRGRPGARVRLDTLT